MKEVGLSAAGWGQKWPAPAKLNLMLRVVGRREDGYHLLQTVFQIIDLCDWLTFHPVSDGSIGLQNPIPGVPEQDDLTVRAARLLSQHCGSRAGVRIEIEKNLPMGGGLGGGSSDAATVLVVLNKLWGLGLSREELMKLGLQLGADVPIFIFGSSAWGEGVGEDLEVISLPKQWFVIIKPDCHVNTKEIFCSDRLTRNSKIIKMADFLAGDAVNDCEAVVRALYKPVADAMSALASYGEAKLTGTGACVFACFGTEFEARKVQQDLSEKWVVYLAKAENVSPLYRYIEQG